MKPSFYIRFWFNFIFPLTIIMGVAHSASAEQSVNVSADIEKTIKEEMRSKGVQGLAIAVLRDGKVDWTKGYGVIDYDTRDLVTEKTTFQAASLGKVSAAYTVMMLAENGTITLGQPLSHPRMRIAEGCEIPTVQQALSHTTGMENDFLAPVFSPECEPGKSFKYSGQGFAALAELIGENTSMPAADAIAEMVFTPLGMDLTQYGEMLGQSKASGHISFLSWQLGRAIFRLPIWLTIGGVLMVLIMLFLPAILVTRSRGFGLGAATLLVTLVSFSLLLFVGTRIPTKIQISFDSSLIAASLTTNAEDLAIFGAELMRPTLMSIESRDLMFAAQTESAGCIQWGLGIGIDTCSDKITYWHWGSNTGFESLMVLDVASGNGVIILTNTGGGIDTIIPGRGGHEASKSIARKILGIDGAWDLSGSQK